MASTFFQERIAAIKLQIVAYEDAITAIVANPIQMYKLDTGQSVQSVSYINLTELQNALDRLMNRLVTYEARCSSGSTHGVPAW